MSDTGRKCIVVGCTGEIKTNTTQIQTGCHSFAIGDSCDTCGRIYWSSGRTDTVFNRRGSRVFLLPAGNHFLEPRPAVIVVKFNDAEGLQTHAGDCTQIGEFSHVGESAQFVSVSYVAFYLPTLGAEDAGEGAWVTAEQAERFLAEWEPEVIEI